ncbi:Signal recognition particle protein [Geranomyces variabilis]|uniref:Signal recognition particle protein n=1 Tax=Geranomyces variabilis TaxID=109894 RepID=A0AAD5TFQ4_9FUNG|nr:Signal recognition particle protein [Geranomyces variabilis]
MVYLEAWDDYQKAAEELYLRGPLKTRFVSEYRHKEGTLVLKVFDGVKCLKYRTDKQPDLKKFERLTLSLMCKMQNKREADMMDVDEAAKEGAEEPAITTPIQSPPPPAGKKARKKKKN